MTGCDCGDNINGNDDAGPDVDAPVDATPIDAPTCDTPAPGVVGGACSQDSECDIPTDAGGTGFCLNDRPDFPFAWPLEGFCTIFCTDDFQCGDGASCSMLSDGAGGTFGACMPNCCDEVGVGQACETGRLCTNALFGEEIMTESCVPGTPGAEDGDSCTTFADCEKNGACRSDTFQFPGGQCATLACNDDDDCASDRGKCVDLRDEVAPICVQDCDTDADCREAEGYRCIDRGGLIGKFCQHPGPGDDCTADADCGLAAEPWACRDGATYPGGYCTIEDCDRQDLSTCPIFSFCVSLAAEADTYCADQCQTAGGDECGTGYDCAATVVTTPNGPINRNVCVPTGSVVNPPPV